MKENKGKKRSSIAHRFIDKWEGEEDRSSKRFNSLAYGEYALTGVSPTGEIQAMFKDGSRVSGARGSLDEIFLWVSCGPHPRRAKDYEENC